MKKEDYQKPDIKWLKEKLNGIKLGWLKASEIEVYVAYMLMYDNDLEKTIYDVAEEYGYTESKVTKLQVEFSKRFRRKEEDDSEFLERIFNAMISKTESSQIIPIVTEKMISFTLYDATDARRLRKIINKTGMMSISDTSKLVFNLPPIIFATLFLDCCNPFREGVIDSVQKQTKEDLKNVIPSKWKKTLSTVVRIGQFITEQVMATAINAAFLSLNK